MGQAACRRRSESRNKVSRIESKNEPSFNLSLVMPAHNALCTVGSQTRETRGLLFGLVVRKEGGQSESTSSLRRTETREGPPNVGVP